MATTVPFLKKLILVEYLQKRPTLSKFILESTRKQLLEYINFDKDRPNFADLGIGQALTALSCQK